MGFPVGLAVKASQQKCTDPLFSFLLNIDSYRLCCSDDSFSNSELKLESEGKNKLVLYTDHDEREEEIVESHESVDGTIVLSGDGKNLRNNKFFINNNQIVYIYI